MTQQLEIFQEVDWNFPESATKQSIHSIHPYPAKFIPEIPRELIRLYGVPDGTAILDPFCGSGTTLVEAQHAGVRSVGVDLNPVACLISRVKTQKAPPEIAEKANHVLDIANTIDSTENIDIPNVDHWFEAPIKHRLAQITAAISRTSDQYQDVLSLALSSIIVKVSNQESDTRYAAIKKSVTPTTLDSMYLAAAKRIEQNLVGSKTSGVTESKVFEKNILLVDPDEIGSNIGLVITSPPYPNAYEYWLYHKYRMYWLGKDPKKVKEQEIGARAHYFKKNHATIHDFQEQMKSVFFMLKSVCVPGAKICFVVGRSKIHGQIYDNSILIKEAAEYLGFKHVETFERDIKSHRKSFNLSHAEIKKESIVVMEKAF